MNTLFSGETSRDVASERQLALTGWPAAIGATVLVLFELLIVAAATSPSEVAAWAPISAVAHIVDLVLSSLGGNAPAVGTLFHPISLIIGFTLTLCLVGFSFVISSGPWEFLGRTAAVSALALPTVLLSLGVARTPVAYAIFLIIHAGIALWFLDAHIIAIKGAKRAVALTYGAIWITLGIDAVGRHTPLNFSKDIELHPALGAFNDFRLILATGMIVFWIVGAFVATIWDEKKWVNPLNNPFLENPDTGRWGGARDGLEWLAHRAFLALDIAWRGLLNAFVLLRCYAGHLGRDYIKGLFDKGYLLPVLRHMLSIMVIGGIAVGSAHVAEVLSDYLVRPSGIAELVLGPLSGSTLHGNPVREIVILIKLGVFMLVVACSMVFQAWNWETGGQRTEVVSRTVIAAGVTLVSFGVTGILGAILSWSRFGSGTGLRSVGLVSTAEVTLVILFVFAILVSQKHPRE
jgi:hypothetical protein